MAERATPRRLQIKRAYEPAARGDGARVLVDRLWPRGLSKERAALHAWMPEVAPSVALRKWFDHKPARFAAFSRRYREELAGNADALAPLRKLARRRNVTLVYGARDEQCNHALVLADFLRRHSSRN